MEKKKYFIEKPVWNRIIAKIWADESYKEEFEKHPNDVLAKEGVVLPEGLTVHVVKEWQPSTPTDYYFVLRDPNNAASIKKSEARKAAAGGGTGTPPSWWTI